MIGHLLNRVLRHRRPTEVDDGAGGKTTTMVDLGTVRCRLSQPRPEERLLAAQSGAEQLQAIYFLGGTDVRRGDVVDDAATGESWRVTATVTPSKPEAYVRADGELIEVRGAE